MCRVICKRQELANHEKNLTDGLIDVDGMLLEGAFCTFSSPIQVVHCPVKTDLWRRHLSISVGPGIIGGGDQQRS